MKKTTKTSRITPDILSSLPSPCWLLEEHLLEQNLQTLSGVKRRTGTKILLALKGFAFWSEFGMMKKYLDGVCASGLHEAILGNEEFGSEVHTYSPAYKAQEIDQLASISNHMVFNSIGQLDAYGKKALTSNPNLSLGLRVNPEHSEAPTELYNPCAPYSRLGITASNMKNEISGLIDGLHFHALCEQDADALERVLRVFEEKFSDYLPNLKWVNFGGGHHITRDGYDIDKLVDVLAGFRNKHPHLEIYLEPGEAVGWETGVLIASVLDIVHNGIDIAILDISAEAHMPDTIIMPYRAEVRGAAKAGEKRYNYRLGGNTCLAGDIMGDYSFDNPLQIGDKIVFEDQMHYTMVKATTFNGIALPTIAVLRKNGDIDIIREFGYDDFKNRLG